MERRDFVKRLTAAGAGLASLQQVSSANEVTPRRRGPNDRINVAVIGARGIGGRVHLPTIISTPESELIAVCDVDRQVLEGAISNAHAKYAEVLGAPDYTGVRAYTDYRELLARKDLDAVVIATPDHWHVPLAKAAVAAGKDVYVEKPLSLYVTEGRELVDLVAKSNSIVQVGSQQRTMERFLIAKAAVMAGVIGELKHVEVLITTREGLADPWEPQPVPSFLDYNMWLGQAQWMDYHPERLHYNFRFVPEVSGGEIANWGAHFLDSAQHVLGFDRKVMPVSVNGRGRRHPVGSLHTSFYGLDVDYVYANGLTMKMRSDNEQALLLEGEKGSLFVQRGEIWSKPADLLREIPRDLVSALRKTKGSHMDNWIHCMLTRKREDLHAPVEIGNDAANLCHMANIAIELERKLYWDNDNEIFKNDAHANAMLSRPVRDWESA